MLRPATDADRDAVLALGVAEEAAWFGEPEVSAAEVGEWIDEEGGLGEGVVAVGEDGAVRGFAAPGRIGAVFVAEPRAIDALADELLPWLLRRRDDAEVTTYGGDAQRVAAFERHGLRHLRSSFSLVRAASAGPLPAPAFPDGVQVAPYRLGTADHEVHRLIYVDADWAAVPGHVVRTFEDWREVARPNTSSFLARRDGRPVGWVSGRILDSGRGYISSLAVATTERGRGLGRALLLHGLADLRRAGAGDLSLAAVAANEAALSLYRSVGLDVEREWRLYGP